jgi:DSBA-like thioredoxin domain
VSDAPTPVRLWIDPSCPWAWQAFTWLRDLRDQQVIGLTYAFFSLEINTLALERNATDPGVPYVQAAPAYGEAFTALAWARRAGGQDAVERLLVQFGTRRHGEKRDVSPELLREAAVAAEIDLPPFGELEDLQREILAEYAAARALDVFGVPTLQVADHSVIYGPIIAVGPTGEDGVALWREVAGVVERPGFFELKRWPRGQRPGGEPVSA